MTELRFVVNPRPPEGAWFEISIDPLPEPRTIRVVTRWDVVKAARLQFARILHPHGTKAYVWESYGGGGISAWVQRMVTPEELPSEQHVFEIRRTPRAVAHALSMNQLEREQDPDAWEDGGVGPEYRHRWALTADPYTLGKPPREDPPCIFNTERLLDLPPPEWPRTGTVVEYWRNLLQPLKPTLKQSWSGHVFSQLRVERREERHANRVLDNEDIAERRAYKKRMQMKELVK